MFEKFTISANVNKDIESCFQMYHAPAHIKNWNFASDDWECPKASSEFKVSGRFNYYMQAKDQSVGFDFTGTFDIIETPTMISYHLDDNREVEIHFKEQGKQTYITVLIDAEKENSVALQKRGWQSILNNYKKYVESI
ncbi:MAG: SRPBCC domain-containing protein [Firmicutes bacterium]|nr:SRPBCC domain-containing protein [Bacillota bacterium]